MLEGIFTWDTRSFYFASDVVTVISGQLHAMSSMFWSDCRLPADFVSGYMSTVVCCWPHSQIADLTRPHLCRFAVYGL